MIGGATGLPAYTLPPVPQSGPPAYGTPAYGRPASQGASLGTPPPHVAPYGGFRPTEASPSYGSATYGGPPSYGAVSADPAPAQQPGTPSIGWPSTQGAAVPQQRAPGTVYGGIAGQSAIDMTMPVSSPMESSGSLTGHILAQGWTDTPAAQNRSNVKVAVVMLVVLATMIGMSLLFLFTAGDAMTKMFSGLL